MRLGDAQIVGELGNAKVAGLTTDLHLTGLQYNLCSAIFFVRSVQAPYCLYETHHWP